MLSFAQIRTKKLCKVIKNCQSLKKSVDIFLDSGQGTPIHGNDREVLR